MWMVYYFIGSMIGAVISLEALSKFVSLFFKGKSRTTSKPRSSSESGQR